MARGKQKAIGRRSKYSSNPSIEEQPLKGVQTEIDKEVQSSEEETPEMRIIRNQKGKMKNREDQPEVEEQQQPDKKDATPRVVGLHIPDDDDVIYARDDGLLHSLPADGGKVLIAYRESWAKRIYETPSHCRAVRVLRHQRDAHWDLFKEVLEVIVIVKASDLWPAIKYGHQECDRVTASAFAERFAPETYTFHIPFGEMTITPDDANKITGLRVTGESVDATFYNMIWDELYKLAKETLGWTRSITELEFCCSVRDATSTHDDKAYMLYTLGRDIFPDTSGNKVSAQYLQFFKDVHSVNSYAWGTASLAYLLNQLAQASRLASTNVGGNFTMLQSRGYFENLELFMDNRNSVSLVEDILRSLELFM
ncbi:protein MAINTENANCE OF MERISTEMS-like [Papaver somniferum]|uniref:protein MAINTENANCE OF MERISTEMS-like n=1 Tax=Papaver somniferum TaxID=3469 RepID=UPI000E6F7907|nr:protein MAINTENANCE OF MERISTEMS-like [Papaver somniferum]